MSKTSTIILGTLIAMASSRLFASTGPQFTALLQELQTPESSDQAAAKLLKQAKADPEARKYLAANLPPMIEKGPVKCPTWGNVVQLAGDLKIAEAAPALAKWIGQSTGIGTVTLTQVLRLENDLAGKALAQIGDPALPVLNDVLKNGSLSQRTAAVYALRMIASPSSKNSLRLHVNEETDPVLRDFIQNTLEKRN